jgi:putative cardiolipin synthase
MFCRRLLVALLVTLLAGCAGLPPLAERTRSAALSDTAGTHLGQAVLPFTQLHPGQSGLLRLFNGRDAFAARVRLADIAERSLDVQYYIWQNDLTGTLLLQALRRAADRGVRVRLLLDDNGTRGLDEVIAAAVAHKNVEVRLFNPFANRAWRGFESVADFARLNRRMHNKSFTADNQATIVGGRNVGDSYFGAETDTLFVDLDVLAIGPVVADVSRDFDAYWASESSYPAERLIESARPSSIAAIAARAESIQRSPETAAYAEAVARQPLVRRMAEHDVTFEWAVTHLVSDDPAKARGGAKEDAFLWAQLLQAIKQPRSELTLVSAYFVPGEAGADYLAALARSGVRVLVVTNSLEATDVAAVHSGYARWRHSMLAAGVDLWEMKRAGATAATVPRSVGSSRSSLHAKIFEIDRSQVFIGSFNVDPRSQRLNTEMGFVVDSPGMASDISATISLRLKDGAYRLRLTPGGSIQWIELSQGQEIARDTEPGTTFWQRFGVGVLSLLPIDWLL